jgi:hypothetical protein
MFQCIFNTNMWIKNIPEYDCLQVPKKRWTVTGNSYNSPTAIQLACSASPKPSPTFSRSPSTMAAPSHIYSNSILLQSVLIIMNNYWAECRVMVLAKRSKTTRAMGFNPPLSTDMFFIDRCFALHKAIERHHREIRWSVYTATALMTSPSLLVSTASLSPSTSWR